MSRRRRGALLIGLALGLGFLAASDIARREAALDRRLAPLVDVVVAQTDLPAGEIVERRDLALRRLPGRWAPVGGAGSVDQVAGSAPAVDIPAGAYVTGMDLAVPSRSAAGPVRRGERAVEVVAAGSPELVVAGTRVDVLVTREDRGTTLDLQDVEVLAAAPAAEDPAASGGVRRVAATLRVTLRQAVHLTAAQAFAREVRLLPRAGGDHERLRATGGGR